jgi:hypothetical protein
MFRTSNCSYMQFYGISLMHPRPLYQAHPAIDQTAYMDTLQKYHKTACTVFLKMNSWMFETFRRHYNYVKTLM